MMTRDEFETKMAKLRGVGDRTIEAVWKIIGPEQEEQIKWAEIKGYIDTFYEALNNAETTEARDRLRLAQVFTNSVDLRNDGANMEYVKGLAMLLDGASVGNLERLIKVEKISKRRLPRI